RESPEPHEAKRTLLRPTLPTEVFHRPSLPVERAAVPRPSDPGSPQSLMHPGGQQFAPLATMIIVFAYAPPMITPDSRHMWRPPVSKAGSSQGAVVLRKPVLTWC